MTVTVPLWSLALPLVGVPTGALLGVFFNRWWQGRHNNLRLIQRVFR